MNAKGGQILEKPNKTQRKEFSIKLCLQSPGGVDPYKAKIELKKTDPTAPTLGQAPATLISEVQGTG